MSRSTYYGMIQKSPQEASPATGEGGRNLQNAIMILM